MKKKLLLLCMAVLFGVLGMSAADYNLFINGNQVTDANKSNVPGASSGKVSFDPSTNTLTLNNATIIDSQKKSCILNQLTADLKINVVGTCKLATTTAGGNAIYTNYSVRLHGTGTLDIDCQAPYYSAICTYKPYAEIEFDGPATTIKSEYSCIAGQDESYAPRIYVTATSVSLSSFNSDVTENVGNFTTSGVNSNVAGAKFDSSKHCITDANGNPLNQIDFTLVSYDLFVKSTKVTARNSNDVFGDGTVQYNAVSNKLFLMNANLSVGSGTLINYSGTERFSIQVKGKTQLQNTGNYNIILSTGPLYIDGWDSNAELNLISNCTTNDNYNYKPIAMSGGSKLEIYNLKLNIQDKIACIGAVNPKMPCDVVLEKVTLNGTISNASVGYGAFYDIKSLTMNESSVVCNTYGIIPSKQGSNVFTLNVSGAGNTFQSGRNGIYGLDDTKITILGTDPAKDKIKFTNTENNYSNLFFNGETTFKNVTVNGVGNANAINFRASDKYDLILDHFYGKLEGGSLAVESAKSVVLKNGTTIKSPEDAVYKDGTFYSGSTKVKTIEFGDIEYGLHVGGKAVTSANYKSLGNGVTYDPATNTLTLDNYSSDVNGQSCVYYSGTKPEFIVKIKGKVNLSSSTNMALSTSTANMRIIGDGTASSTLNCTTSASSYTTYAYKAINIGNSHSLYISDCTVNASGPYSCIGSIHRDKYSKIYLDNVKMGCVVSLGDYKYGAISEVSLLDLKNSEIVMSAGSGNYSSLICTDKNLTIQLTGKNTMTAGNFLGVGIYGTDNCGFIEIKGTNPETDQLDMKVNHTGIATNRTGAGVTVKDVTYNVTASNASVMGWISSAPVALTLDNMYGKFNGNVRNISSLTMLNGTKIMSGGSYSSADLCIKEAGAANPSPVVEFGQITEYKITLAGKAINSANAADILGNGKASFDPATGTLTLKEGTYSGIDNQYSGTLNIVIDGAVEMSAGILNYTDVNLSGKTAGSQLIVNAPNTAGIYNTKNLTISDLRLYVNSATATGICGNNGSTTLTIGENVFIVAKGKTISVGKWGAVLNKGGYVYSPVTAKFADVNGTTYKGFVDHNGDAITGTLVIGKAESLRVGNTYIYKGYNEADVLGDGTARYDAATNTLALEDAYIKNDFAGDVISYSGSEKLNITLKGSNYVNNTVNGHAIYSATGTAIKGVDSSAKLSLSTADNTDFSMPILVAKDELAISDCVVDVYNQRSGMGGWSTPITVSLNNVTINGDSSADDLVLFRNVAKLNLNGVNITAPGIIYCEKPLDVSVLGNNTLRYASQGITMGKAAATLAIHGTDKAASQLSISTYAVVNNVGIMLSGGAAEIRNVSLTAMGNTNGIWGTAASPLTISQSLVNFTGGQSAMYGISPLSLEGNMRAVNPLDAEYDASLGTYKYNGGYVLNLVLDTFDATVYNLKVRNASVTSDNAADILGDGSMVYDAAQNKLTLNNLHSTWAGADYNLIDSNIDGLTVEVNGDNTIEGAGIKFGKNTVMLGTGSLNIIQGIHEGGAAIESAGVLTVKNITLKAQGSNVGLRGPGAFVFANVIASITGGLSNVVNVADISLSGCGFELPADGVYNISDMRMDDFNGNAYSGEIRIRPFTNYNLYVMGSRVNDINCGDILHDGGKLVYDDATKTLTLTDFQETVENTFLESFEELNVVVNGNNELRASKLIFNANATITGAGKLTVTSDDDAIVMDGGNLIIKDADLLVDGVNGIVGKNGVVVKVDNSNVEINATGKAVSGFVLVELVGCVTTKSAYYDDHEYVLRDLHDQVMNNVIFTPGSIYGLVYSTVIDNGFAITSFNANDVLEDGSLSFDPASGVCVLNNCNYPVFSISSEEVTNVVVNGTNNLAAVFFPAAVNMYGDGTLNINDEVGYDGFTFGNNLTIEDVTLNVKSVSKAIVSSSTSGDLTIKGNAHVTAQGNTGSICEIGSLNLDGVVIVEPENAIYESILGGVAVAGSITCDEVKIVPESESGVHDITIDAVDGKKFDITGRQVTDSYRGIVISNGKKVVKK